MVDESQNLDEHHGDDDDSRAPNQVGDSVLEEREHEREVHTDREEHPDRVLDLWEHLHKPGSGCKGARDRNPKAYPGEIVGKRREME
ncbi:hypothetical protein OIY81_3598 [Cryptosporidium canis]|nr:hypothetical protein OIY81_3598 [Cryptosporidium canis]